MDPLVVRQHKDNQVLFIHPVRFGSVRFGSVRFGSVRFGSELIRCLSPSHPPDHEVVILLFN